MPVQQPSCKNDDKNNLVRDEDQDSQNTASKLGVEQEKTVSNRVAANPSEPSMKRVFDLKFANSTFGKRTLQNYVRTAWNSYGHPKKKFFLTHQHLGLIDRYHFLSDIRKEDDPFHESDEEAKGDVSNYKNFACDYSQSLFEMIAMAHFLGGGSDVWKLFEDLAVPVPPEKNGYGRNFFCMADDEKFEDYDRRMTSAIESLCMLLVPGTCGKCDYIESLFKSRSTACLKEFEDSMKKKLEAEVARPAYIVNKSLYDDSGLIEKEVELSLVVNFLTKPRAVSLTSQTGHFVTEACGALKTNHRKADNSALQEKTFGRSISELWHSPDVEKILVGSSSSTMHSGLFELYDRTFFDPKSNRFELRCHRSPGHDEYPGVEGGLHFQQKPCQIAMELSVRVAYQFWMLVTVS